MPTPIPENIASFNINMSDVGTRRPAFAAEAGRIFALWASVEYLLGTTATVLLGDAAALALLDSIRGRHQQMDALRRAAEEKIPHEETKKLLSRVFTFVNRAAMARNKLAHCVWEP